MLFTQHFSMTEDILYEIAKIVDNEYTGKRHVFRATRVRSCWHLSTTTCDMCNYIKVWEHNNKISSVLRLGDDVEDWTHVQPATMAQIEQYLNTLNEKAKY